MPKKPRSARRRKNAIPMNGKKNDSVEGVVDAEVLSENHTIADSLVSDFEAFDDFDDDEDYMDTNPNTNNDNGIDISSSTTSNTNTTLNKLLDSLSLAASSLTEKRSTKREQALRHLFKSLTQYATGQYGREVVQSKLDDCILPLCTIGIGLRGGGGRGGGPSSSSSSSSSSKPTEQYAACRVLEATSVVLGADEDEYCEIVYKLLVVVVKATGRAVQVRAAALRALSMAFFICSSDANAGSSSGGSGGEGTDDILDLCECVCATKFRGEEVPPSLRAVALDCWALLGTTIHGACIAGDDDTIVGRGRGGGRGRGVTILPLLNDCLNHSNLDLRCAAGECVALIHEARLEMGIDADDSGYGYGNNRGSRNGGSRNGETFNASDRRFRRGSWDGSEWEVLMDEVKQRVSELSVESGHHMSKKAKKEQRATFREFMATIVDDEAPNEIVTFRGGTLNLQTWREIVQLNFIRHCLQSGFQIQLMTNHTLQLIFGADPNTLNSNATMSLLEKRLTLSKTSEASKAADREMLKRRKSKRNKQNHFLTIDGEDI